MGDVDLAEFRFELSWAIRKNARAGIDDRLELSSDVDAATTWDELEHLASQPAAPAGWSAAAVNRCMPGDL